MRAPSGEIATWLNSRTAARELRTCSTEVSARSAEAQSAAAQRAAARSLTPRSTSLIFMHNTLEKFGEGRGGLLLRCPSDSKQASVGSDASQVEIKKLCGAGAQRHGRVRRSALGDARVSIRVHLDGQLFGLAQARQDNHGHGHGVEKRGRLLAPKVIEHRQGVRKRREPREDAVQAGAVKLGHGRDG